MIPYEKKQKKSGVIQQHDKFFRDIMLDNRVAQDFLKAYLPADVLAITDFDCLELQPRVLSDETRSESAVDVLFKTKISGRDAYFFILAEHQNVPDKMMPFRVIHYTCKIIAKDLRQRKSEGKKADGLPLVYSIVFYNGSREWKYSRDVRDLVNAPKELVDQYFLQPFQLIDLNKIDDKTLREHTWAGVAEIMMKHIRAADILPYLKELAAVLKKIDQNGGRDYVEILLQYTFGKGEIEDDGAFFDLIRTQISPEIEENMMSLAKKFEQRGLEQGIHHGIQQGIQKGLDEAQIKYATKMLLDGVESAFISKITELPLEKVLALKKQILEQAKDQISAR